MQKKIVAIGDIHGRASWKYIVHKERDSDHIIFVGDYFDSHDAISPELQMINFKEICQFKEKEGDKVVLLIGNHDEHYFPFMGNSGTSGYNAGAAPSIGHLLMTYKDLLQMAHYEDNVLFSHAGVAESWMNDIIEESKEYTDLSIKEYTAENISNFVNDIWKYKPLKFKFNGWRDPTGDDIGQTPIWIRPRSLMRDSKNINEAGIIQVFGHTQRREIELESSLKLGYIDIDTLGHSGEYLIIENGIFKTGKI